MIFFCLFSVSAFGITKDFYLKKITAPNKLLPDTLSSTLVIGEPHTFYVDVLPKGADTDVLWTISPAIATITQRNHRCIVTPTAKGSAVLTAYADNGISCNIKIKVEPFTPEIHLEASDTVISGESAVIKAITPNNNAVKWQVACDNASYSYDDNMCKVNPYGKGLIKVSATLGDTTVSKSITVLPPRKNELNLTLLSAVLGILGTSLLIFVFVYRRKYEKAT